jgi:porin
MPWRIPLETRLRDSNKRLKNAIHTALCVGLFAAWSHAQSKPDVSRVPASSQNEGRSIEDLNLIGAETAMPPFVESPIDINSAFRQKLLSKGLALRGLLMPQYAQNALQAPVPADQQVYVGEREFEGAMTNWTFTADLRQLHLNHSQLYICGVWNWVSWEPQGPKALQIYGAYFYKSFARRLVEVKAGYVGNNLEVIGLTVGGSTATGAQGVYAVLPYELGLSYFPITAPSLNLRLGAPHHIYIKGFAQRSLDPVGGPAEVMRNHSGLRFDPKGDKLLSFGEAGLQRTPSETVHDVWFRAGSMRNSTHYTDLATGKKRSGNSSSFVLMDDQLRKPDYLHPEHGLYLGGTAMTANSHFNPYDRYFEARLYQKAPFRSRPIDMASVVASYTGHSRYFTDALVADGKTVWRNSASLTGSYSLRVCSGQYLSAGLSYIHGPAITPRVNDALTFATSYSVFF